MRNTFFAFVTFLCYAVSVQGQTIPCTAGVQSGYLCITLTKSSADWVTASETCKDAGGDLLAVTSASLQDTLNTIMANGATNEVWVGGQEVAGPWRFVQDGIDISPQGCFRDPKTNADRNNGINIENLIPERCISACRNASYKYAAVQGGTYCYCYNSYKGKTVTSGCTDQCPGDQTKYCGSWDKSFIYKIDGAYGSWSYNQPNYWDNYQHCGVIDWPANSFKFADEKCNENFDYICEINSQSCSYTSMDGHCLYLSNGNQMSWFAARQDCVSKKGDLVQIDSESKHNTVRKLLTNGGQPQQKYWMGLVSKTWKWTTGESMRGYSAWGSRQPSSPYSECLRVVKSGSAYEWQDGYCTDRKAYVCQFDYTPTTVPTTTVSTTPKPVPQTTTQGDVISKASVTTSAAVISSTASPSMSAGTSSSQSGVNATANPNAFTSASNSAEVSTNSSWSTGRGIDLLVAYARRSCRPS